MSTQSNFNDLAGVAAPEAFDRAALEKEKAELQEQISDCVCVSIGLYEGQRYAKEHYGYMREKYGGLHTSEKMERYEDEITSYSQRKLDNINKQSACEARLKEIEALLQNAPETAEVK